MLSLTVEAPAHAELLFLSYNIHPVYSAMAGFTTDTHIYVSRVIEIGIVREHMNTDPLDGFSCLPALPDEFQIFIICFNLIVAVHTGLSGGDIGMSGVDRESVTILTNHFDLANIGFTV